MATLVTLKCTGTARAMPWVIIRPLSFMIPRQATNINGAGIERGLDIFQLPSHHLVCYFPTVNFLVTGGAGFIGSHVCERLLHSGHHVCAFDDLNDFYDPKLKQQNIRELQSLAK